MLRLTSQMISQSNVKGVFSGHSWSGWATLPWLMYFNIPIFLSLSTPSSTVYQRSSCILASCSINYFLIHVSGNQPNTLLELFLTHQPEKLNPEPLLTWPILINPEWAKYIFLSPFSFTLFILPPRLCVAKPGLYFKAFLKWYITINLLLITLVSCNLFLLSVPKAPYMKLHPAFSMFEK